MSGVRRPRSWPVLLLAAPAMVAIWSGWVGLGLLTGFGKVHPLPGIWDHATINTAITLPIGVETYAAYALHIWLTGTVTGRTARFAKYSALGSLALGAGGQVAYHLMVAAGITRAPWLITALVACLPVAVLGMGASLAHLVSETPATTEGETPQASTPAAADVSPAGETDASSPAEPDASAEDPTSESTVAEVQPTAEPEPEPAPVPARTRRTAGATSVAMKVVRLRERHPDWTVGQIGEKAGCSERTARRHLNAPTTPPALPAAGGPGAGTDPSTGGAPDPDAAADDLAA